MASGMNGQQFSFVGYLPIDNNERQKVVKELEAVSGRNNSTQIFIETPYRNNQLLEVLLKSCKTSTRICVACDLTSPQEWIKTFTVSEWKKQSIDLHKRPCIFLLQSA
jgi:16S rRNA (cytidine1402-2'-O)-methyltransferase